MINPFPSPYINDWQSNPSALGVLKISNPSSSTIQIKLRAIVTKQGRGEIFRISTNPISLTGAPVQVIDNTSLVSFSDVLFRDTDYRDKVMRTGRLLEGEYTVCVNIEDITGNVLASNICANFTILYPSPPRLIAPVDNASLDPTTVYPTFQWTPVVVPSTYEVKYTLKIVEVMRGQTPAQAISANIPVYENNQITTNTFVYPIDARELEAGKTYAWQIQALDRFGFPPTQNDGKSEIFTFTKSAVSGAGNLTVVYPLNNDTIPWNYFPIIFRFDPYSDSYRRCRFQFQLFENRSSLYSWNRELSWPDGPERSQERVLGVDITQEESQHLSLNKRLDESPAPPMFVHGRDYNWTADIEIGSDARTEISGSLRGNFSIGMGKPILRQPANNDTLPPGRINLLFKTSDAPSRIAPPFSILQSGRGRTPATFFNGGIDERWVLEISRDNFRTVDTILANERLGSGIDLNGAIDNPSSVLSQLYKDVNVSYTANDTGWYYWRVKWLSDPNNLNSTAYRTSDVYRFYIGTRRGREIVSTPGDCLADCEAPEIPASERVPVRTASVGSRLRIGLFTLTVTEIRWTTDETASGRGTINVPFLRAPIKVVFNNIRVNRNNTIYEGDVHAEYDRDDVIPSAFRSAGALAGMSDDELQNLNAFVTQASRLVSALVDSTPIGLPIGLDRMVEGRRYTIAIVGMNFTPRRAELNAIIALDFPELHGWLGLGAKDICFHPNGLNMGRGMLYLPIDRDLVWSDDITIRLKRTQFSSDYRSIADSGTFVRWDCNGFVSLTIAGEIIFGRNLLVEDLADGNIGPDQIKAEFRTTVRKHNNWIVSLTFNKPFQIRGVEGFGFRIEEAWLDFSDLENPTSFNFPSNYRYTSDQPLWKGFYLKTVEIKLPGQFRTYDSPTQRVSFRANNMIIDRTGFTANIRAENVLRAGNLNGWSFSIDTIYFDMVQTSFSRAGFTGQIWTSFTDSTLLYRSVLSMDTTRRNLSYNFIVEPRSRINFNLWQATLELERTTNIRVTIDASGFRARAELNGALSINANLPAVGQTSFTGIRVQGLVLQTQAPYIACPDSCVRFGSASPQKFLAMEQSDFSPNVPNPPDRRGGFPVSIQNVRVTTRTRDGRDLTGIEFDLSLNLTGESNTFEATTKLAVLGRLNLLGGRQRWEFDSVEFDSVSISGDVGVVQLNGGLRFYNQDPTYGNGFKGFVRATFRPTISAQVAAQFGSKDGYRYWFVDAQAVFNPGITIVPGLDIYGFGGGAWYKMRRTSDLPNARSLRTADTTGRGRPGGTLSDVTYVPDNSIAFGFQATVIFGNTGGGQTYNADATLGAEFNTGGGVSQMYLRGDVYFLTHINNRTNVPIRGSALISYDFGRNIFDGRFDVRVDYARILNGNGRVHLYISPSTWHIHIGTPREPINVNINIPGLDRTEFSAYFMVGINLPPPEPVPSNVSRIIGTMAYPARDETLQREGNGFAFGARLNSRTNIGRLSLGPFIARLDLVNTGFDMAFKNYPGLTCEGFPPGTPIGINGWYASGQLWAYLQGEIGINVDAWFATGVFKILDVGMAAVLRGGLPNPSWLSGNVGGDYNILGGLVRGNCSFEFTLGERCRIPTESPLAAIRILSSLDPPDGATNVDPYINPVAAFNAEVNREFEIEQVLDDGRRVSRRFKFIIERFELRRGSSTVPCTQQIADNGLGAALVPIDMLQPRTDYNVTIRIRGQEFIDGQWRNAHKADGSEIIAELSHNFRTGNAPDYIPPDAVAYSYPFHTQRYFLIDECRSGVIQLKQGRPDLFNVTDPNYDISYHVKFVPVDGGPILTTEARYDNSTRTISFQIPAGLQTSTTYAAQLIRRKTPRPGTVASAVSENYFVQRLSDILRTRTLEVASGVRVRQTRIDARVTTDPNEKIYYVFFFRTSRFRNLQSKINQLTFVSTRWEHRSGGAYLGVIENLYPTFNTQEWFDIFDVEGHTYRLGFTNYRIPPLVRTFDGHQDNWYNNFAYPVIYDYYNVLLRYRPDLERYGLRISLRDQEPYGIPPLNTVTINDADLPLDESEYLPQSQSSSSSAQYASIMSSFGANLDFSGRRSSGSGGRSQSFSGGSQDFSGIVGAGTSSRMTGTGQQVELKMETATIAYQDYQRLRTLTSIVISTNILGTPVLNLLPTELRSRVSRFWGSGWRLLFRGSYRVGFKYNARNCIDPDRSVPTYYKNYNY
jgi:hypothetical protein